MPMAGTIYAPVQIGVCYCTLLKTAPPAMESISFSQGKTTPEAMLGKYVNPLHAYDISVQ